MSSWDERLRGWTSYEEDAEERVTQRIVIFARVERQMPIPMVVDTGAPWCILRPALARSYGLYERETVGTSTLQTWTGPVKGQLVRADLTLIAEEGHGPTVDATFFLPELDDDEPWLNPNFIGYQGMLQRIRFAVDPFALQFWFGPP